MRRLLFALAALLSLATPAFAETPVERHGQLRVEGNRIVDQHGEPVTLRGMSLFWSQWMPQYYTPETIRWLRDDWRVTLVRAAVAVPEGGYLEHPERETAKAEAVIDAAIDAGLYVIVDWHAHEPEPEAAIRFFSHIASKYGDHPNIIYETWNEPLREHGWGEVVKPYHMAVVPAIRALDPEGLIVAGTPTWSQDVDIAAADPLPFASIAYTLHFYAGSHRQQLRDKAQAALDQGAALFVTEWGTSEATGDGPIDEAEVRRWWDFMEDNHISQANWSIADKVETTAALQPGASGEGGWTDDQLTESGRLVRDRLRTMNPETSAAER
ncbi:glycoside hydrolase family 5 protein [Brevundimonas sp.]|uniref:glycoside hydrolase family 5 protein n=1 Tax=Brevundimonas sp. TaxID=1871086 RepID=UPI0035B15978